MALSRGFPRVDLPTTLPFDVRTFLEGSRLRGRLTCSINLARERRGVKAGSRTCARAVAASSDRPQQADDSPEHPDLLAANRLHRLVLRLQADVVGLTEEPLDGRLLTDKGHDYVAVLGGVL